MPDTVQLRRATNADSPAVLALVSSVLAEYGIQADACHTDADIADLDAHYFSRGGDFVVLVDAAGGRRARFQPLTSQPREGSRVS